MFVQIEKTPNPKDQRSSLYRPTLKLLSFLGVSKLEQMPKYSQIKAQIKEFEKEK